MKTRNFNVLARPTDYEASKMLMDREDAMKPYIPVQIPKMKYHIETAKNWSPTAVYVLMRKILTGVLP